MHPSFYICTRRIVEVRIHTKYTCFHIFSLPTAWYPPISPQIIEFCVRTVRTHPVCTYIIFSHACRRYPFVHSPHLGLRRRQWLWKWIWWGQLQGKTMRGRWGDFFTLLQIYNFIYVISPIYSVSHFTVILFISKVVPWAQSRWS